MTTPAHRINEFSKRGLYYRNNYTVRLNSLGIRKNGFIQYKYSTFVWTIRSVKPILIDSGKYNCEDPYSLIDIAEKIFGKQMSGHLELTPEYFRGKAVKGIKSVNKTVRMSQEIVN